MRMTLRDQSSQYGFHALEVFQASPHVGQVLRGELCRLTAMGAVLQGEQLCDFVEAEAQTLR
ncbi:hypothetical protein RhoFW510T8_03090 [Rhodanobacter sp. FW510-T8]|nr:hypothetical protein RhoFW510T8_03090 [Rhodanobacter sp. FW510-T8]